MKRALSTVALSVFALAVSAWGVPALAQDEPARLTSRGLEGPPLSTRAMPAAPSVHKLSIGPLAAPGNEALAVPPADASVAETLESLLERARQGDAHANYRLGLRYLAGDGVTRDIVEAFARVRLAAAAGHPRAVSLFYFLGAKLTAEEHGQAFDRSRELRTK